MPENIIKQFDIVIFGATGYTGRYVIEELSKSIDSAAIKWAVAGRNLNKLTESLVHVQQYLGDDINIQNTPIIYADTNDPSSLSNMCKRAKLILNCAGPYTLYGGESVVSACIDWGTHHIDISAELKYLETVQVKYFTLAREKGVYIIEACGVGSLPADYGISLLKQKFSGNLNSVEYYVKFQEGPKGRTTNIGTFLSGIHSVKDHLRSHEYDALLQTFFKKNIPQSVYPLEKRWPLFYGRKVNNWCVKYVGPDQRVLKRSQMLCFEFLNEESVHSKGYFQLPSLGKTMRCALMFCVCLLLNLFSKGQELLTKFPSFFTGGEFSNTGPSRKQVSEGSTQITLFGTGWKDKSDMTKKPTSKIKLTITGPEPAYPFTAMCMVHAGLVVLQETDKLPFEGGVLTPGVAFKHTTLLERLEKRGMMFQFENEY